MTRNDPLDGKLVTLIGGNGFLGSHVAQKLLERGARLRIAARHPEKAYRLKPLANLGQLQFARCNAADRASIAACVAGSDAVAYLVGTFDADQEALQAKGASYAAAAAKEAGAMSFVYISAIGVDAADEQSEYSRTKGLGERMVLDAFPKATILRPSILFGEDDDFINMFAGLVSTFPVLPVFAPDAKLQPLWVDDAADALTCALADPGKHGGKTYELGGPDVITMRQLHEQIAAAQQRKRTLLPMPDAAGSLFAALPLTPMNADQWTLLKRGNVAGGKLPGIDRLGIAPKPLSLFLEDWMVRYRTHGRFTQKKPKAA